jgi:hypothetical protein
MKLYHVEGWSHSMPDLLQVKVEQRVLAKDQSGDHRPVDWDGYESVTVAVGTARRIVCERVDAKAEFEIPPIYEDRLPMLSAEYDLSTPDAKVKQFYIALYTKEKYLSYWPSKEEI